MKRKLTKASLSELELHAEIVKLFEQKRIVGGGTGTYQDPLTYSQWLQYCGINEVYYYDQIGHLCWSGKTVSGYNPGYDYCDSGNNSGGWNSCIIIGSDAYYEESGISHNGGSSCNFQSRRGTCVPHVMSWAAAILGESWMSVGWFVTEYRRQFSKEFDVNVGVNSDELEPYLRMHFDIERLNNTANSIRQALNTNKPVIGTLKTGASPSSNGPHEVLINGVDSSGNIVCTNPGNDKKETYSINNFQSGSFYKLNSTLFN